MKYLTGVVRCIASLAMLTAVVVMTQSETASFIYGAF
jgi:hypothetical protein